MPPLTECKLWIRSTDLDADGIVNNARYFEFFEQGRLEHLVRLGVVQRPRPPGSRERAFTIVETTCRFRAPLQHRDWIVVRTWTGDVRQRSFILAYEILRDDDGTPVAEGTSAQVWLDAGGHAAPIPAAIKERLRGEQP